MEQGKSGQQRPSVRQDRPGAEHSKKAQHRRGGTAPKPAQTGRTSGQSDSDVGKDTDDDGRVVTPGHKAGEIDGPRSRHVGKDTDDDGRTVRPGHKPGEVDGPKSR